MDAIFCLSKINILIPIKNFYPKFQFLSLNISFTPKLIYLIPSKFIQEKKKTF